MLSSITFSHRIVILRLLIFLSSLDNSSSGNPRQYTAPAAIAEVPPFGSQVDFVSSAEKSR
jgi:hypothetical protein